MERILDGPGLHQIGSFGSWREHVPARSDNESVKPQAHSISISGATRDRLETLRYDLTYIFLANIQQCLQELETLLFTTVSRYLLGSLGDVYINGAAVPGPCTCLEKGRFLGWLDQPHGAADRHPRLYAPLEADVGLLWVI